MKQRALRRTLQQALILISMVAASSACATYHFGKGGRVLPGGYDRIAVPMFANKTQEVGIETYFTQELRTQFERSRLAKVTSTDAAQMVLLGTITSVAFNPTIQITSASTQLIAPNVDPKNSLPNTAVLTKQYSVALVIHLEAHKSSDDSVIWQSDFQSQREYQAPLLGAPLTRTKFNFANVASGPNTSAPLYNENSRQDTIAALARDMMAEAHDRLTENF